MGGLGLVSGVVGGHAAGFTAAILLDASRWKPDADDELSPEDTAVSFRFWALRFESEAIASTGTC